MRTKPYAACHHFHLLFLNTPPGSQDFSHLRILWEENKSLIEGRMNSMFSASASPAGSNGNLQTRGRAGEVLGRRCQPTHFATFGI